MSETPQPIPSVAADQVSAFTAMRRGFLCRCPACNGGRLFGRYLKVVDHCEACGTGFHHHRADDFPPYLVMFVVGHLIGYGILMTETRMEVPLWAHLAIWPALTLILGLALLQPMKGAVVGLQFALGMHGFGAARARKTALEAKSDRDTGAGSAESHRFHRA